MDTTKTCSSENDTDVASIGGSGYGRIDTILDSLDQQIKESVSSIMRSISEIEQGTHPSRSDVFDKIIDLAARIDQHLVAADRLHDEVREKTSVNRNREIIKYEIERVLKNWLGQAISLVPPETFALFALKDNWKKYLRKIENMLADIDSQISLSLSGKISFAKELSIEQSTEYGKKNDSFFRVYGLNEMIKKLNRYERPSWDIIPLHEKIFEKKYAGISLDDAINELVSYYENHTMIQRIRLKNLNFQAQVYFTKKFYQPATE